VEIEDPADDQILAYDETAGIWKNIDIPAQSGNAIINGAFDIWQRGTSFTGVGTSYAYQADRFRTVRGAFAGGINVSRQPAGLDGFEYTMKIQRQAGNTSTQFIGMDYALETKDSMPLVGKTITLSFYAKAGANFSAPSLGGSILTGTGNDQPVSGFTNLTSRSVVNAALTTSWQRFTTTATIPTGVTQIGISFTSFPTGTAGAEDSVFITGVQLEAGTVANDFRRNANSLQGELAACQRYYHRFIAATGVSQAIGFGMGYLTGAAYINFTLPVQMRARVTSIERSGGLVNDLTSNYTPSTFVIYNSGELVIQVEMVISGGTNFRPYFFNITGTNFVGFSAEL
jgi:hypothetical protein